MLLLGFAALQPLDRLSRITAKLADGDTDVDIDGEARKDALGTMARSLRVFRDSLIAKKRLEADDWNRSPPHGPSRSNKGYSGRNRWTILGIGGICGISHGWKPGRKTEQIFPENYAKIHRNKHV